MTRYFFRRLLQALPTLLGVMVAIFFFVRALPGDPARLYAGQDATAAEVAQVRERFGLDRSLPEQFGLYIAQTANLELGTSFRSGQPVAQVLRRHLFNTVQLALWAILVAVAGGIVLGVIAALRRNSLVDLTVTAVSILGVSTPSFFLAMLLIYLFAITWGVLPVSGSATARGLVLPTITLAAASLGTIARFARSSFLEVAGEDYVRTARSKGLGPARVALKHILRNSLIPVVTIIGLQFGTLLSGAVIVETVFNFPGLGWLLIQSIDARDYPVIQALMLVFALQFILINLLVDIVYGFIDPRVSYE